MSSTDPNAPRAKTSRGLALISLIIGTVALILAIVSMQGVTIVEEEVIEVDRSLTALRDSVLDMGTSIRSLEKEIAAVAEQPTPAPIASEAKPVATKPATENVLLDQAGSPLTVAAVQRTLEALGFAFESAPLNDGTPRMLGQKDTTLVELYGARILTEAGAIGIADQSNQAANLTIVAGFAGVLNATAPWAVSWWNENLEATVERAQRANAKQADMTRSSDDVVVKITVDANLGSFALSVKPVPY